MNASIYTQYGSADVLLLPRRANDESREETYVQGEKK